MGQELLDPYATDRTPRVTIQASRPASYPGGALNEEIVDVEEYSIDQDALQLGNSCSVLVGNPNGVHSGKLRKGDRLKVWMTSPDVAGGAKVQKLDGLITKLSPSSTRAGTKIAVTGADKGWHLVNNDGPLWDSLSSGILLQGFLDRYIDRSWGFHDANGRLLVASENDRNRRLNQGRAGRERAKALDQAPKAFIPPFQWNEGQKIAPTLIEFARREKVLVTVSTDGVLLFWAPNYKQAAAYRIEYHNASDSRSSSNNVLAEGGVQIEDDLAGVLTDVTAVSSVIWSPKDPTPENPNAGKFRGRATSIGQVGFLRRMTFTDGERANTEQATAAALATLQRGLFDAYTYTVAVQGHSQNGIYYSPDTIWDVNDTVNGVAGPFYCSAVKLRRTKKGGSFAMITLHLPGLLYPL